MTRPDRVRLAAYTDYVYHRDGDAVYAERAFALFLARLGSELEHLVVVGRLDPRPGPAHYRLPDGLEFVGLPHYQSLFRPGAVALALARSLRRFWAALAEVDVVWLLGPHPVALAFATLARLRGRRIVLGVRQDLPSYVRSRHPTRRWIHVTGRALEFAWRALARQHAVIVVGPELADRYSHAGRLLELSVSLITEADIASPETVADRSYGGELRALSVGRLEAEKNPLLLAEVLARLPERWRLVVCGEGPLAPALRKRLRALGLAERAELRGYVPIDGGLLDLYRTSHAFLHVSLTEGLPQVLFEAFAGRLPVVATRVGGVATAAGEAAVLIPPDDAQAAAVALERVAAGPGLRARLIEAGVKRARERTLDAECRRVAEFLAGAVGSG
ncbi:MAG: glycosyltransferase family 4 protein [Solirubrobacterales bacterium]